jgi:signal transduction histidine kinase
MSQSSSVNAVPLGGLPARGRAGSVLALRNWRVTSRLIVLVAIPAVLGLALAGLWITDATRSAGTYSQVGRLAAFGQQATGLAQALEDERADTATFIAQGRPATGLPALHQQYLITDRWAATVRQLVPQLRRGYPAQTRASAATVLASIAELPGLRRQAAQTQAPALAVINGYSKATAGLFSVNDSIADLSGNSTLITSVRALGSLSRMKDEASQQQAILDVALAQGHFEPGALTALTSAQARQASDLASFRGSATQEESWALGTTLASPQAGQAQAVEQRAIAAGNGPLALGAQASQQWRAGMSYTVSWMRHAEQQLTGWITSYAQGLRQSALRSAVATGVAGLAGSALVLLATLIIARSMVRPLRRLEAAALHVAGARLPAVAHALGSAGNAADRLPVTPIDVPSSNEIGQVARAFDQLHGEAVQLAAEQARQRDSIRSLSTRFFRRSYSLQEQLLRLIDNLELTEDDPERLASLFQMDHLVTRMRRLSDSALVLADHQAQRDPAEPYSLFDVLRAAVSEIEQYDRVTLNVQRGVSVSRSATADTVHLLAELLENATAFSPQTTQVIVSSQLVRDGGSLITITDGGPGLPAEQLMQLNWRLAHPPLGDLAESGNAGLCAVAHLAARHGIAVTLTTPPDGGATAEVHLPATLISHDVKPGRRAAALDVPFSALRFAARPEPPLGPETGTQETVPDESVPLPLGAPTPPPARHARGATADQQTCQTPAGESAEISPGRRDSLQRGAHRMDRGVRQPDRDG